MLPVNIWTHILLYTRCFLSTLQSWIAHSADLSFWIIYSVFLFSFLHLCISSLLSDEADLCPNEWSCVRVCFCVCVRTKHAHSDQCEHGIACQPVCIICMQEWVLWEFMFDSYCGFLINNQLHFITADCPVVSVLYPLLHILLLTSFRFSVIAGNPLARINNTLV